MAITYWECAELHALTNQVIVVGVKDLPTKSLNVVNTQIMAFDTDYAYEIVFAYKVLGVSQTKISKMTGLCRGSVQYQTNKEAQLKRQHRYLAQEGKKQARQQKANQRRNIRKQEDPAYREYIQNRHRKWYHTNKEGRAKCQSRSRQRDYQIRNEIPCPAVKAIYLLANNLTEATGIRYVVDHIQPLCAGGEHAAYNLQVIPWEQNASKSGKWSIEEQTYFCNGLFN